jgi:DNA repair photolyase
VNVGLKCSHDCTYCSTGAMLRCHPAFKAAGESPFGLGYAMIDPAMPDKVAADTGSLRARDTVQLCTTVDAWDPVAQEHDLGRRCLKALLENNRDVTVRVLTKNAAVANDFDLIQSYRDRVLVGISLTGTVAKEPNASTISARMAALKQAHEMGLRTYGMLCPLLPGVSDSYEAILELVGFVKACGAEEVFAEAVNPRGRGLILTATAFREHGHGKEADAADAIRKKACRMEYVVSLVRNVQRAMRKHQMIGSLRYLLYGSDLTEKAEQQIRTDDAGIVWL